MKSVDNGRGSLVLGTDVRRRQSMLITSYRAESVYAAEDDDQILSRWGPVFIKCSQSCAYRQDRKWAIARSGVKSLSVSQVNNSSGAKLLAFSWVIPSFSVE